MWPLSPFTLRSKGEVLTAVTHTPGTARSFWAVGDEASIYSHC